MSWAGHEAEDSKALVGEIIPQDGESTCAGSGHMHSDVTKGFSTQWKHRARFTASTAQFVPGRARSPLMSEFPSLPFALPYMPQLGFPCQACPPHPPCVCFLFPYSLLIRWMVLE